MPFMPHERCLKANFTFLDRGEIELLLSSITIGSFALAKAITRYWRHPHRPFRELGKILPPLAALLNDKFNLVETTH